MCIRISDSRYCLTPPLRLVLNSNCNGNCPFCHQEGNRTNNIMDSSLVYECADIAEKMKIPHISLTGGEPTLRDDLGSLIAGIQSRYSGKLSLTTNGFALSRLSHLIKKPLYMVNLSIVSFSEDVYKKYQNVDPYTAIQSLIDFSAIEKNINVVIVEENFRDIKDIIEYCLKKSLSIHIMFELKDYTQADIERHNFVMQELKKLGQLEMQIGTTPKLVIKTNSLHEILIKHPKFSKEIKWDICNNCDVEESCFERVCAVRVYPDEMVTPCLNGHVTCSAESMAEKIAEAYKLFTPQNLISSAQYAAYDIM